MALVKLSAQEVGTFLAERYGQVEDVEPLDGGFWSSAYSFSAGGQQLVARFGQNRSWFEADRGAMAFSGPDLPVPAVLEIGDAFDGSYAVSVRYHGTYLEDVTPEQSDTAGPMLGSLLLALYEVPGSPELPVDWYSGQPAPDAGWRHWLLDGLVDDPGREVHGWRATLAADPALDRLFRSCESRIQDLIEACGERRDLVHGDLLHGNVLVSADASHPVAVFSWKCSVRGDFLFDTAWCTFWSSFHPGIAAADPWGRIRMAAPVRDDRTALVDASLRHHCYELQIGTTHLGWYVWVGDRTNLGKVAAHLEWVLERGPLPD